MQLTLVDVLDAERLLAHVHAKRRGQSLLLLSTLDVSQELDAPFAGHEFPPAFCADVRHRDGCRR